MKQTIDVIKVKIKGESEESGGHRKYLEEMERRMEELKMKQESTTMTSKNLEHMLDRMKKDDIINQMRVNELENKVKVLEAHIVDTREQNMSLSEFGALSTIAVKTVEDGYLEAKEQRRRDMTHFENIMFRRTLADERTEERQRITEDIQAMAASDLNDSEIVKWKKLFMVQKFLKKLLKQKIANIEEKYSDVKNAFYTIKLKTNVTDPAGLISNFFNLEETYQKLLENVRNMENKTSVLEKTSKGLDREFEETKAEILLLTANRDSKVGSDLQREAEDVMEKSCQSQLIEDKIYFWLINTMYKLDSASDKLIGNK
jgi:predicted nuclease with TOPRIM domain